MKSKSVKKFVAGLLMGALLLFEILYLPGNHQKVYATGVGAEVIETKVTDSGAFLEKMEVKPYRESGNLVAPKPQDESHKDWVFAGWYISDDCKQENALEKGIESGVYWAKFVPAELLSVKCQTLAGTEANTPTSKIRLVSTVDGTDYARVGFEIKMKDWTHIYDTDTVCEAVAAKEGGVSFDYAPTDVHSMARYFTTVTLTNIDQSNYKDGFFINPYWTTLDGTKVYGMSRYARVEDSYLSIINVPVRLYRDQAIAAGYLQVTCNDENVSYYGWDAGNVFEEMETSGKGSVVNCVGNVADIAENKNADGMFVNLRFQWNGDEELRKDIEFTVSRSEFCDRLEKMIPLSVTNVSYKYITSGKTAN